MAKEINVSDSILRNEMRLPLRIDEAVYLLGALKDHLRQMKNGESREFVLRVYDRLKEMYLDITQYNSAPF